MIVITTTSDRKKTERLERSLLAHGYSYHIIEHTWGGFLDKLHQTYKYLKAIDETHFIYTDAWDTVALRGGLVDIPKLFFSSERACYPYADKAVLYPEVNSPFKYVNGGGFGGEVSEFIKLYESHPPKDEMNDQVWLTNRYLDSLDSRNETDITLDLFCEVFQTLGFCQTENFIFDSGLKNTITNTYPYFLHGNGHTPLQPVLKLLPMTFDNACSVWINTTEGHRYINESFAEKVNETPKLKEFRDYVESTAYGFGERSFIWFWNVLAKSLPDNFKFLEIGVYRGQSLAAIKLSKVSAQVTGITPLYSTGCFHSSDYAKDIKDLHAKYKLKQPIIWKGLSSDHDILDKASKTAWDVIYIDGGHTYECAHHDVFRYSSFVKVGGYLVIDDCANGYPMPDGYFRGIADVSKAVDELLPNEHYTEVFSVVHIRVFKRIK